MEMENRNPSAAGRNATWSLGALAIFFFGVEVFTGLGLAFHYRPTLESAYFDVLDLRQASGLGWVSKLHYWGSHALILVVWLHLVRTFMRGAYRAERRSSWMLGVVLLVPVLLLASTGARLPMDTHAVTELAGQGSALEGADVDLRAPGAEAKDGTKDLWRFYVLHCILLPGLTAALIVVHVRKARRVAAESMPAADDEDDVQRVV